MSIHYLVRDRAVFAAQLASDSNSSSRTVNREEPQSKQTRSVGKTKTPGSSTFLRPAQWINISVENSASLSDLHNIQGMTTSVR
jgi:hypothetical protein